MSGERKPKIKVGVWGRPKGMLQSEETKKKISESVKRVYQERKAKEVKE